MHKIERQLTARGGGKALAVADAKNARFFYVLPYPRKKLIPIFLTSRNILILIILLLLHGTMQITYRISHVMYHDVPLQGPC